MLTTIPDGWGENVWIEPDRVTDIQPGGWGWATLYVRIPENATVCENKYIRIEAESQFCHETDYDEVKVHVVAPQCGVDLWAYPDFREGAPGTLLTFNVYVYNTGNITDNFDLWVIPDGWGENVWIEPTVVQNVPPGGYGYATLYVRVPILKVRGVNVSISPNYQSGAPCTWLEYTVTVTNTGTESDSFDLIVGDNAVPSWNPVLDENVFENVPPGESRVTILRVHVSDNALPCTQDNILVTAISRADPSVSDSASCIAHAVAPVDNVRPIIENALAIPDMIALMVEDTGPLWTKLIVDAGPH
jgi:uncharacterized membrane protein